MNIRGTIKGMARDFETGKCVLTVEMTEGDAAAVDQLRGKDLAIDLKTYREKRSKTANGLLWACLGEIAAALGGDKWDYYLQALRKYGQYTLVEVKEEAVDRFREIYRECEEIGRKGDRVHLLCYFGSSTYNSKEFSVLLDGVIEDMKQAGLPTPTSEEMRRTLEALEREEQER